MSLFYLFLILFFVLSLITNILFLFYDFIPFVSSIIKRKFIKSVQPERNYEDMEKLILSASLKAVKGSKMLMVWKEPKSISERIFSFLFTKSNNNIVYYNFPRAFLYYGLIEYLFKTNNKKDLILFKNEFDRLLDSNGNPEFHLEKVDQAMFGNTALKFYELYKEEKYLSFANYIYEFIENIYDINDGLVFYRKNSIVWYYDTLGMVLPFLVYYYKFTSNEKSIKIAKEQMALYIKLGMDKETFMPAHGVNLKTNVKVGSINWGRGLGWYLLGLESMYKHDGSFSREYLGIVDTLLKLRNENGLWTQFPGSSLDFDASASVMIISCLPKDDLEYNKILDQLNSFISSDGFILQTSGDTYGANRYSETFGKSELSQGMLLFALSRFKN